MTTPQVTARRRDAGLTIVELLITIIVASIVVELRAA